MKKQLILILLSIFASSSIYAQCTLDLGNDSSICNGESITLDAEAMRIYLCGDSLEIVYDATQGVTGLVGAAKVYMHSAAEMTMFGGWEYPVGNWGIDDGVGEMTSIGTDLWRIRIHLQSYYSYGVGCEPIGLFMVFRNADGTQTGKDNSNNDVYIDLTGIAPTSGFGGVSPTWQLDNGLSFLWSDGSLDTTLTVSTAGQYHVTISGLAGCSYSDTINISVTTPSVTIGNDTITCSNTLNLDAGSGFVTYSWSNSNTTQIATAVASGSYSVTVIDASSCTATDNISVTLLSPANVNLGLDTTICAGAISFILDAGSGYTYEWNDASTNQTITAISAATYTVTVSNGGCTATDDLVISSGNLSVTLPDDTTLCNGTTLQLTPQTSFTLFDDSLRIVYDATLGVTGLVGVSKVYMHSTYEEIPFGGAITPWTGNWGIDDGLGQMTSIGTDLWEIVIQPNDYYGFGGMSINGLFMLFRNEDGTLTGKDGADNDIFVDMMINPPTSTFGGVSFNWITDGHNLLWSDGSTQTDLSVTTGGVYYLDIISDGGCQVADTIVVNINVAPSINLGNDTVLCGNTVSYLLNAGAGLSSYIWSSTQSTQTITALSAGNYSVTGTDVLGCQGIDSVFISLSATTPLDLGIDTTICTTNGSYLLDAGAGFISYLWNTSGTSSTETANASGMYYIDVVDTGGCSATDTINLTLYTHSPVDLGNDQMFCTDSFLVLLDAGVGYTNYVWNTLENTQSISVTSDGTYQVSVSDGNGCSSSDEVIVSGSGFSINLGADISTCSNDTIWLNSGLSVTIADDSLVITYDATQGVTGLVGASKVYMHSTYEAVPFGGPVNPWTGNWGLDDGLGQMTNIGNDLWTITIHPSNYYGYGQTAINGLFMVFRNEDGTLTGKDGSDNDIWIDMNTNPPTSGFTGVTLQWLGDAIDSWVWSDGSVDGDLAVTTSGTYWFEVVDTAGCLSRDSIMIDLLAIPNINLGSDTAICAATISYTLDAGAGYTSYNWSDGSTGQTLALTQGGNFSVTVINSAGCSTTDYISIQNGTSVYSFDLGNDTVICGFGVVELNPNVLVSPYNDSLTITYDATQGVSGLMGSGKVYMHSAIELHPLAGWQYVTGNWGTDDGIGQMDSIGIDLWQITINPVNYYGYNPDSSAVGLYITFRNADGSLTGKDNNDDDIWVNMNATPPTTSFGGIQVDYVKAAFTSINWSTGSSLPSILANTAGIYYATLADSNGCVSSDTINVNIGNIPLVDVGNDAYLCSGETEIFIADSTFSGYLWSDGSTGSTFSTDSAGIFSITVTDSLGCTGVDYVQVEDLAEPIAIFVVDSITGNTAYFTESSQNAWSNVWDYDNDGFSNGSATGSTSNIYPGGGAYTAILTVSNECGDNSTTQTVIIEGTSIDEASRIQVKIYPTPASNVLYIETSVLYNVPFQIVDIQGRVVKSGIFSDSQNEIQVENLTSGSYVLKFENSFHKIIINH